MLSEVEKGNAVVGKAVQKHKTEYECNVLKLGLSNGYG